MKIFKPLFLFVACIAIVISVTGCAETAQSDSAQQAVSETRVFEMRTYTTHDGKLDDLHQRFENHTMAFFEKHGMKNIGYWVPEDPELKDNTLIYILSHESTEAAENSWDAFRADPEWQSVYEKSRRDGPIVRSIESVYMKSTAYSQI
ncbi:NIPSNAP family protein [Rhodohalobacter sp. SW132]|uniref:NIPSNAP family protein n=1 Tax=Rhodohalobacter sp. SW132 TaxID=2293433 RepID=UPI000E23023A|nr:NIPSNAP family protein [Rhodohalobacter sp. SW132]REL24516.1 NIPSNAP family protein [Rhodohalobacter sp. SW132]